MADTMDDYLRPDERSVLQWLAASPHGIPFAAPTFAQPATHEEERAILLRRLALFGLAEQARLGQTSFRYTLTAQGRAEAYRHRIEGRLI